jgi:FAD binding domain
MSRPAGARPGIAIVGGGIGGLAAAAFLHRAGLPAVVYEQAAELREVGAGVVVAPNACRLLRRLGVLAAVQRQAVLLETGFEFRRWRDGTVLSAEDLAARCARLYGEHTYTAHRADTVAVELPDGAAPHVPGGLDGQLDDMEQVHGNPRALQHPADGGREDRAHVDGDDFHRVAPGRRGVGPPSSRRHRTCGPRPGRAGPGSRPGRRSRRAAGPRASPFPGVGVLPPPGPAAPVLVNAQVSDRGRHFPQDLAGLRLERSVRGRPGDAGARAASAGVIPRSATSRPSAGTGPCPTGP